MGGLQSQVNAVMWPRICKPVGGLTMSRSDFASERPPRFLEFQFAIKDWKSGLVLFPRLESQIHNLESVR